ncbi:AsmA family protein [Acidicapsa acidisoli]|uniref:AsmA family protein n=1 Tax=Acidicapsa acidisoli TaxID=1615681 RepID=UPI0021DFDB42|nr:AsmA family protein [Acidicapsa acidisoli]
MTDQGARAERAQTGQEKSKTRWRRRITVAAGLIALLAAGLVLPPLINISRYQRRVAALMTQSLGRPVHMSSVELRLLPLPGFVLHDLSVSEDPEFGAEPILSARTVVASVRLQSLWRGKLEIYRVSVDEASLNLVRSARGRWNLSSLMLGAQPALTGGGSRSTGAPVMGASAHFPYLEATNSRVNLKNGAEKSPYSLVSADLSLWQDEPGKWRVRLRGQPVRTDIEMSLGDTGEVRMEARLQSAAELRAMPIQLQMEWRNAQLGQLSRLLFGSDAGWRGDVTADIDVQGTPESAQTRARLRATGVRREEFSPAVPMDFDANCNFRFQHSQNALHQLGCDTAIGDGRLHLKAELPGNAGEPEATLEVQQVPLQAGLDMLRTIRSGFAPGLSVAGNANGSLSYSQPAEEPDSRTTKGTLHRREQKRLADSAKGIEAVPTKLKGTITVDGGQIKGGELKEPVVLPKMVWTPSFVPGFANGAGLGTKFTIALGAGAPVLQTPVQQTAAPSGDPKSSRGAAAPVQAIAVRIGVGARGFDAALTGTAGTARVRELAYGFGLPHLDAADGFTGGTADVDVTATGPWIPAADVAASLQDGVSAANAPSPTSASAKASMSAGRKSRLSASTAAPTDLLGRDSVSGTVQLHHAQWKAAYLARPVDMLQATITFSGSDVAFASDFTYGSAKDAGKDQIRGSAQVNAPTNCKTGSPGECVPAVQLRFGSLDAAVVQSALVGTPEEKSLLSPLLDRMRSSEKPKWPEVAVNVQADALAIGAVVLQKPVIHMRLKENEILLEDWEADLLGGSAKGTGRFAWASDRPDYTFDANFSHLSATSTGALIEAKWTGGPVSSSGNIHLSGLTPKDLVASASGNLNFDWQNGAISTTTGDEPKERAEEEKPRETKSEESKPADTKFDEWKGVATIHGGTVQVGENTMRVARRTLSMAGEIPFGGPAKLAFASKSATRRGQPDRTPAVK